MKFKSRPPTVDEAVKILSWSSSTKEWRQRNLVLWESMGADVAAIKAKFLASWKKKGKSDDQRNKP